MNRKNPPSSKNDNISSAVFFIIQKIRETGIGKKGMKNEEKMVLVLFASNLDWDDPLYRAAEN